MSAELHIPDRAWEAVAHAVPGEASHEAAAAGGFAVSDLVERGVRVAAPLIVAAWLREYAATWRGAGGITPAYIASALRARADELDPS